MGVGGMEMLSPQSEKDLVGSLEIMENEMKIWDCVSACVVPKKEYRLEL